MNLQQAINGKVSEARSFFSILQPSPHYYSWLSLLASRVGRKRKLKKICKICTTFFFVSFSSTQQNDLILHPFLNYQHFFTKSSARANPPPAARCILAAWKRIFNGDGDGGKNFNYEFKLNEKKSVVVVEWARGERESYVLDSSSTPHRCCARKEEKKKFRRENLQFTAKNCLIFLPPEIVSLFFPRFFFLSVRFLFYSQHPEARFVRNSSSFGGLRKPAKLFYFFV